MTHVRVVIRWKPIKLNEMPNVVKRLQCLIGGHSEQMVCRSSSVALHCVRCGRTTPGWHLDPRTPRRA